MSTTEFLDVTVIDEPKSEIRPLSKEFCGKMANSLRAEGMHHPIGVRPHPEKPGRYIRVFGRHRLAAARDILKWERVECKILVDISEEDAEMAALSENLWRNPLTAAQAAAVLKRWWELYQSKNTHRTLDTAEGRSARAKHANRKRWQDKPDPTPDPIPDTPEPATPEPEPGKNEGKMLRLSLSPSISEPDSPPSPEPKPEPAAPSFVEKVAEASGVSVATAKRQTRIARSFSREQLEALGVAGVNATDLYRLATQLNEAQRAAAVNLVASGMPVEEAIVTAKRPASPSRDEPPAPHIKTESELSDDEWLATCDLLTRLPNPAAFRRDALLYRRLRDPRQSFRKDRTTRAALEAARGSGGAYYRMVSRFLSIAHPRDWILCGRCRGVQSPGKRCPECMDDGYKLRTES